MIWDHLTSPQLAELNHSIPVILPIAATEQHGAHLPLATDRMIGEHFCQQLNKKIPDEVLILPSQGIGCSEHHMDFAGSLTLNYRTFLRAVEEVLRSVAAHNFRNLIVFNSHGGNQGIGRVLLEHLGRRLPECRLVLMTWWQLAADELLALNETGPGGVGHAGEFETSLMLHIAPKLVRTEKIKKGANQSTYSWAEADMLRGSKASIYRTMKEMTRNGVFGDPTTATAAKGKAISKIVVKEMEMVIRDLKQNK